MLYDSADLDGIPSINGPSATPRSDDKQTISVESLHRLLVAETSSSDRKWKLEWENFVGFVLSPAKEAAWFSSAPVQKPIYS